MSQNNRKKRNTGELRYLIISLMGSMILFASCAGNQRMKVEPSVVMPPAFSVSGEEPLLEKWWKVLGDSQLDALVDTALSKNFSLLAIWDRLDQARETAIKSGASLWPEMDFSASSSRTRTDAGSSSASSGSSTTTASPSYRNNFSLGVAASYEADLWGRVRSGRDAARLEYMATEEDVQTAVISLSAEIVSVWYQLQEQTGQLGILREQETTNLKQLDIITMKFRSGLAAAVDVLQQRQVVESIRGEKNIVQANIQILEHTLSVLIGQPPGTSSWTATGLLPELPSIPETGIPLNILRNRPDIRALELRVQSSDRRLSEAIANQFPKLSISASVATSGSEVSDLFSNWITTLAANLVGPIFDGGNRRAEVRRNKAVVSERLNNYNHQILSALKEIEDALSLDTSQGNYVSSLAKQMDLSEKAAGQIRDNYTMGSMDFTRYLTTLQSHQKLQRTFLQARGTWMKYRINLYRAMAGTWPLNPQDDQI